MTDDRASAEEILAFIRDEAARLSKVKFDPVSGALPLRTDAFYWLAEYLCGKDGKGILDPRGCFHPAVQLHPDGTIAVRFFEGDRVLTLRVLAKGVVITRQSYGDGLTRIDRMLSGVPSSDVHELADLFGWLHGGSS